MTTLLVLPVLVPLATAAAALIAGPSRLVQRLLGVAGTAVHLGCGVALLAGVVRRGTAAVQVGSWPAPFGITLVADVFSGLMVVLAGGMGLATAVYSLGSIDARREAFGYWPLVHVLLMGVSGAFLTGDVFNLFVWFEVLLIASFALLALGGERPQLEGAIKYVALNLVSSALFLSAVGLLYGLAGTLNMAHLSIVLRDRVPPGLVTTLAMLLLAAFGIKAAAFPFFSWLPASYHTPPVAVTALYSALLTKVGVYALVRVFTLLFTADVAFTHGVLLVVAALTMVTGVLGAVAQMDVRRLLSFHIVSQIGYLIMGLGLLTPLALAGTVFFIVHVAVAKAALFLVSGIIHRLRGTWDLKRLGGFYAERPGLALLFGLAAASLAGIPPFSGFVAKVALVRAGLEAEQHAIVAVSLGVSILTLFSMVKIWAEAFWKARPADDGERPRGTIPVALAAPTAVLAALALGLGVGGDALFALALRAGAELAEPHAYVAAVLAGG